MTDPNKPPTFAKSELEKQAWQYYISGDKIIDIWRKLYYDERFRKGIEYSQVIELCEKFQKVKPL